ncbi:MAG: hypothetical protein FWD57_16760, partial [Polyangiaceae bacterium]|nr:hypothetical protein [Polyangiaceae bacterium]
CEALESDWPVARALAIQRCCRRFSTHGLSTKTSLRVVTEVGVLPLGQSSRTDSYPMWESSSSSEKW